MKAPSHGSSHALGSASIILSFDGRALDATFFYLIVFRFFLFVVETLKHTQTQTNTCTCTHMHTHTHAQTHTHTHTHTHRSGPIV